MDTRAAVAASDPHQEHGFGQGVRLVVGVAADHAHPVLAELLGPVARLAGLTSRAQVVNRRGDRPRIGLERNRKHLPHARKLALHEPRSAGADVTGHAFHARVGRSLVRREFGLHHGVTGLPAKSDAVHIAHGLVGEQAAQHEVDDGGDSHEQQQPPQRRAVQRQRRESPRIGAATAFPPRPQPDPDWYQGQAGKEHRRENQECQDPHVGMGSLPPQARRKQE